MSAAAGRARAAAAPAVLLAGIFSVLVWGGTPVVTRYLVTEIDGVVVGMLRTVLPAFLTLPLALGLRIPPPRTPVRRGWLLASALGGFVIFPILLSYGLRFTSASHAALILATLPVFTGLISYGLDRRLPPRLWWAGVAVAAAGTAALVGLRLGFTGGPDSVYGDLMILSGCGICCLGYVAGARLGQSGYGPWGTTFWSIPLGAVIVAPLLAWLGPEVDWAGVSALGWASLAYLGLGASILAYVAWYWALSRGGVARIGLLQYAQPVVTLLYAALLLGEPLSWSIVAAAAVIMAGILVARRAG